MYKQVDAETALKAAVKGKHVIKMEPSVKEGGWYPGGFYDFTNIILELVSGEGAAFIADLDEETGEPPREAPEQPVCDPEPEPEEESAPEPETPEEPPESAREAPAEELPPPM